MGREKRNYEKDYRKQKEIVKEQEKKILEKGIEGAKMEAEIKESQKEIENATKKYNELVARNERENKVLDNIKNDLATKQQRIVKLEYMLKKKSQPPSIIKEQSNEEIKKLE